MRTADRPVLSPTQQPGCARSALCSSDPPMRLHLCPLRGFPGLASASSSPVPVWRASCPQHCIMGWLPTVPESTFSGLRHNRGGQAHPGAHSPGNPVLLTKPLPVENNGAVTHQAIEGHWVQTSKGHAIIRVSTTRITFSSRTLGHNNESSQSRPTSLSQKAPLALLCPNSELGHTMTFEESTSHPTTASL